MMKKITCGSKVGSLPNGPYIYICSQSYSTKLATKFCDLPFFAVAKFSHLNANSGKSNSSACKWLYGCYASVQDVTFFVIYTKPPDVYFSVQFGLYAICSFSPVCSFYPALPYSVARRIETPIPRQVRKTAAAKLLTLFCHLRISGVLLNSVLMTESSHESCGWS